MMALRDGEDINVMNVKDMATSEQSVPLFSKGKKRAMVVTLSDEESDDGGEDMTVNKVTTLTVKCSSDNGIHNQEISTQDLSEEYKLM